MDSVPVRRHFYSPDDDGLASLADTDPNPIHFHTICHSTQICSPRASFRSPPSGSPRSGRLWPPEDELERRPPHFLQACFLCRKQLGNNRDIFMRGDTAFCSEECRQEQIDTDESNEKKVINPSSSMKALRRKKKQQQESTNRDYKAAFHLGAVAAA